MKYNVCMSERFEQVSSFTYSASCSSRLLVLLINNLSLCIIETLTKVNPNRPLRFPNLSQVNIILIIVSYFYTSMLGMQYVCLGN